MADSRPEFPENFGEGRPAQKYPDETPLFLNGITSARIEQVVARPMQEYLRRAGREAMIVAHHWRTDGSSVPHEGWLTEGVVTQSPTQAEGGVMTEQTTGFAVFLRPEGGLLACISGGPGGVSRDVVLMGDTMDDYYRQTRGKNPFGWEVSEEARRLNRVTIGAAVTRLAMAHGILEQLIQFATTDPHQPG